MLDESLGVEVAFNLDEASMKNSIDSMASDIQNSLGEAFKEAEQLQRYLSDAIRPLRDLRDQAKLLAEEMHKVKTYSDSIRENAASARLQAGGSSAAGGGGLGSLLSGGGLGGLMGGAGGWLAPLIGAAGLGSLAIGGAMAYQTPMNIPSGGIGAGLWRGVESVGQVFGRRPSWESETRHEQERFQANLETIMSRGGALAPVQALMHGVTPEQIMGAMSGGQARRTLGAGIGLMRGIGQGPLGMFSQVVGTSIGMDVGANIGRDLIGGTAGEGVGAALGGAFLPGFINRYAQEAMSRYPGYLQTSASMASVGQYGGDLRQIRGTRPTSFGYGPGEIGPEFSALYQGFGGGELSTGTLRTSMAYARAYGVGMGQIGQAVGGLLNVGGGGQTVGMDFSNITAREDTMARIMADAVASGFGRRLPEFAQAVGSGLQTAMQGPALIANASIPGMIASTSRLTSTVATRHGVGLQAAQRMLAPVMQTPQNIAEGIMSGGGDPYQMAMYWAGNRERFGGNMDEFMFGSGGLMEAAQDPFGAAALELNRRPIEEILQSTGSRTSSAVALRQLMPGMTMQGAQQIITRGREAIAERGSLEGVDMTDLFTGVTETEVSEGEETRDTMRDVQRSGEEIMNQQLGAMRANAGFAAQQHAISGEMARDAREFHKQQMGWTRVGTHIMRDIGVSSAVQAAGTMFNPEFLAGIANTPTEGIARAVMARVLDTMRNMNVNLEDEAGRRGSTPLPNAREERTTAIAQRFISGLEAQEARGGARGVSNRAGVQHTMDLTHSIIRQRSGD